jgi:hypothetical protein
MRLTVEILLTAIKGWREQIVEALEQDDPEPLLRHLCASMLQAEEVMRQRISPDDEID